MFKVGDIVKLEPGAQKVCLQQNLKFSTCEGAIVSTSENLNGSTTYVIEWDEGDGYQGPWHGMWLQSATEPTVEPFYIIWCPTGPTPPRSRFTGYWGKTGYDNVLVAAERLAKDNPGQDFFICEMKARVKSDVSAPKITKAG